MKSASGLHRFLVALLSGSLLAGGIPAALAQGPVGGPVPEAPANPTPTMYSLTYGRPFFDAYEWRDSPRRHLYIHGGFEDSHLRFSIYLPPKEYYRSRFLLMLEGGTGGSDKMMTVPGWDWAFDTAFDDLGAYLIETNEGHWPDEGLGIDNPKDLWQASGYATNYARQVAERILGAKPQYGYVTGCSGGGTRSSRHVENLPDLINGSVSEAWGHLGLEQWSVYGFAGKMLGDKLADVKDAMEVGGSKDPYKGLTPIQAEAVRDWLGMGMVRDGVGQWKAGWFTAPVQMYYLRDTDPTYFTDFWTKPGYEGHDNLKALEPYILDTEVAVEKTLTAKEVPGYTPGGGGASAAATATYGPQQAGGTETKTAVVVDYDGPQDKLAHATLTITSGPDKGKFLQTLLVGPENGLLRPFIPRAAYGFNNVKAGDRVKISNRDYLAYIYYYRYHGRQTTELLGLADGKHDQLFPEFRVLMDDNGKSKWPQRKTDFLKPQAANFKGKIIALSGAADEAIWPTSMNAYIRRVHKNLGANTTNQFRMWWIDDHPHCGGTNTGPGSTSLVPVKGITRQALIDLSNWVEKDIAPPADVAYGFSKDNELLLPADAKKRGGIQPVAALSVNGGERIEVTAGNPVKFIASGEVPPGAGTIVKAEFDFDGQGTWPEQVKGIAGTSTSIHASATHVYDRPGTYFAAFRVASHRDGAGGRGDPIYDLARVRVVVK